MMNQEDPEQRPPLDPRAVPVAVVSFAVIVFGVFCTYANVTFGALIVLLGLFGLGWVARMSVGRPPRP
jgi:hypothetical protein